MRRSSRRVEIASGVLLRVVAIAAFVSVALLASVASALGAVDLGAGDEAPSIVYDATSGYTYVAWQDPVSDETIDLCAVPSGGTVCNGGAGPYKLTDPTAASGGNTPKFFGSKVLVMPGGTVVVVANIDGASAADESPGYTASFGEVAWSSAAGGEAFGKAGQGLANGGKLLAEASGEMPNQGALALNATSIFTYGNEEPFNSGATDFTLTAPALNTTPLVDLAKEFGYNGDVPQLAVEEDPAKSGEYLIVAVGNDPGTPKECALGSNEGTGYGVAKGTPAALQKQTAWSADFKVIACPAEESVLTGGEPSGGTIGVVQDEGAGLNGGGEDGIYFQAFNPSGDTFGSPVPISQEGPFTLDGADGLSASDDSGGGIYAMWIDGRGIELSYSTTSGSSWLAPVTALPDEADHPIVAGIGGGSAEAAYFANIGSGTQEYLQPFNYSQLLQAEQQPAQTPTVTTPITTKIVPVATATTTNQSGGGISGSSLTVPQGTAVSDQAHISGSAAANATGTVTYNLYKDSKCTVAAAAGSVASVVKGVAGSSTAVKPAAGTYYWKATYSGDAADDASTSACGSEVLVVALSSTTLGLPSSKICLSRRKFVVHPRAPKGVKLVSVEVEINGKLVKKGKLSNHATSVSLVGLPKGTFKVALITRSSKGKVYEEVRTFHTCVPGKHK